MLQTEISNDRTPCKWQTKPLCSIRRNRSRTRKCNHRESNLTLPYQIPCNINKCKWVRAVWTHKWWDQLILRWCTKKTSRSITSTLKVDISKKGRLNHREANKILVCPNLSKEAMTKPARSLRGLKHLNGSKLCTNNSKNSILKLLWPRCNTFKEEGRTEFRHLAWMTVLIQ